MYIINEAKVTREDVENILLNSGIEKRYDYSWSRGDNLTFQKKSTLNKARAVLIKTHIKIGTVDYLFGDYYLRILNIS